MSGNEIYRDISERTKGQIYIGVVGPVRSGKSTFIRRFMETLVLPNVEDDQEKQRARDELPQGSAGKTVMTTEPKFIPEKAAEVKIDGVSGFKVRMIDCVGFIVDGAEGLTENGAVRMVNTPWSEEPVPFDEAAETGTRKVISEHCSIAVLVTTDGTIGEIPRKNYEAAEEKTVEELRKNGKPFVIILNCADPNDQKSVELAYETEEKYNAPVALVNCLRLDGEDIKKILEMILPQFPVTEMEIDLPEYLSVLGSDHRINRSVRETALKTAEEAKRIKEVKAAFEKFTENENVEQATIDAIDYGTGKVKATLKLKPELYYATVAEITDCEVRNDADLFALMKRMRENEKTFGKYVPAIRDAEQRGYGVVEPDISDMTVSAPETVKQAGGYGVRLKVTAHMTHLIGVDITTEINPVVGTEQQSGDLVRYLSEEYDASPENLWNTNMFGKTIKELADDGLKTKTDRMSDKTKEKFAETLGRVINEGSNGMICIIL